MLNISGHVRCYRLSIRGTWILQFFIYSERKNRPPSVRVSKKKLNPIISISKQ